MGETTSVSAIDRFLGGPGGARIPPSSVGAEAEHALRAFILSGAVRPGERLVEERLCERFGVSRPLVREALRSLEQQGLVTRLPRRGSIVTPLDADDVREIYSLRWALERFALDLAMPVEDPSRLDPLREAIDAMRAAAATGDRQASLDANADFHLALCALPGHRRLIAAYRSLMRQLLLCMAMNLRFRDELLAGADDSEERHRRLLRLIEAGDVATVHREIDAHGDQAFMDRLDDFIAPIAGVCHDRATGRLRDGKHRTSESYVGTPNRWGKPQ